MELNPVSKLPALDFLKSASLNPVFRLRLKELRKTHGKESGNLLEDGMKVLTILVFVLLVLFPVVSAPSESIERMAPEELKKWMESRADIVVVDAQPKVAYEMGHIKGAINFPWAAEIKPPLALSRNKPLILYCDCAHEEDAEDLGRQLSQKWGYTNIKVLEGGWSRWRKLGYPVEKGEN